MTHPCVLLVEDDGDIREVIEEALERRGYPTRAVEDGEQALAFLRDADPKPSVILLDLTMPRMSGWEFLQIQAGDPSIAAIPVVVLSAVGQLDEQAARATWAGVLTKPVTLERLVGAVERFCRTG